MATRRKARRRKTAGRRKVTVRRPPKAASSRYRVHRGRSSSSTFRAHKGRHSTALRAHGKRRLSAHPARHPKAVKAVARKKPSKHTVASHRCGQPLHHTARKTTTHRPVKDHRKVHRHMSKAERKKISEALTGRHHTCACKTVGSKKLKRHLSKKTRERISRKLRRDHAGHKAIHKHERIKVLKHAKHNAGRGRAANKKPC